MSTILTNIVARGSWIVGLLVVVVLTFPIAIGTVVLFTEEPGAHTNTSDSIYEMMTLCVMGVIVTSILNLWMHIWRKHSGRSSRWLARGFVGTAALILAGILWIRALYLGINDDLSEHGAFFGWFAFAMILVAVLAFNFVLFWRRTHSRRRKRSHPRSPVPEPTRPEAQRIRRRRSA